VASVGASGHWLVADSSAPRLTEQQVSDLTALMHAFTDRTLLTFRKSEAQLPTAPPSAPPKNALRMFLPILKQPTGADVPATSP
jgi:hypothetical protein